MQNDNFKPNFLATGVGSIPLTNGADAMELIWKSVTLAPHWPQLPRLGADSSFIGQYLNVLIETGVIGDVEVPKFQVEAEDWVERMTVFYSLYLEAIEGDQQALDRFGFSTQGGEGFEAFCSDLEHSGTRDAILLKGQLSDLHSQGQRTTELPFQKDSIPCSGMFKIATKSFKAFSTLRAESKPIQGLLITLNRL